MNAEMSLFLFVVFITKVVNGLCPSECSCSTHLSGVNVHCQSRYLSRIPDLPYNTYHLGLNYNIITEIDVQFCMEMPQLKYLYIYNNSISEIPINSLVDCEQLYNIYFHDNRIRSLESNTFINMSNLYELYLHNNNISTLKPPTFVNLPHLQYLTLHNNDISTIQPFTFMNLPRLHYLDLGGNKLSNIGEHTFGNLTLLSTLNLHNNNISTLDPFTFMNLPNLHVLTLFSNKISIIESFIFMNLQSLQYIDLSENNISHIEKHAFGNSTLLSTLLLTSNLLNCDCSIYPFWSWLIERACIGTSAKCSNGKLVTSLKSAALEKCNPYTLNCFNGGKHKTMSNGLVVCECIGKWTGKFCQENQCISHDCGSGDCYIEPINGTAQCVCDEDRYVHFCPGCETTAEQ